MIPIYSPYNRLLGQYPHKSLVKVGLIQPRNRLGPWVQGLGCRALYQCWVALHISWYKSCNAGACLPWSSCFEGEPRNPEPTRQLITLKPQTKSEKEPEEELFRMIALLGIRDETLLEVAQAPLRFEATVDRRGSSHIWVEGFRLPWFRK